MQSSAPAPTPALRGGRAQVVDQLRGLAEGADVPFDPLFALNCNEEFTCLPEGEARPPEHCTSFAFRAGGRTVAGHNEDWYPATAGPSPCAR